MFINRSDSHALDWCWTKDFPLRRITLFTNREWKFLLMIDSWQSWCQPPKIFLCFGMVVLHIYFKEALIPELSFTFNPFSPAKKIRTDFRADRFISNLRHGLFRK